MIFTASQNRLRRDPTATRLAVAWKNLAKSTRVTDAMWITATRIL